MLTTEEMLDQIQALRIAKDEAEAYYNERIEALRLSLAQRMRLLGEDKVDAKLATAYFQKSTTVKVDDWNEVMDFVIRHKATDILQKRISVTALEARIKTGQRIKGVTVESEKVLAVRAKKGNDDAPQTDGES